MLNPFARGRAALQLPRRPRNAFASTQGLAEVRTRKVRRARRGRSAYWSAGAGRTRERTKDVRKENNKIAGALAGAGATCGERGAYTFKAGPAPPSARPPPAPPPRPRAARRLRCALGVAGPKCPLLSARSAGWRPPGAGSSAPTPTLTYGRRGTGSARRGGEAQGRGLGRLPG